MFTIKLKGGMGNQMFQYATGRFLAHKTSTDFFLDTTKLFNPKTDTFRQFDLDKLNIKFQKTPPNSDKFSKLKYFINQKLLKKYYFDHEPKLLKKLEKKLLKNKKVFLEGYFQSEKNFLDIREILLQEFSLKEEFKSQKFLKLQKEFASNNSVAIHVRRGDYANNPTITKHHGTCSLSYYQNAIKEITKRVRNPKFYFFSDDPDWIKENFKLGTNSKIVSDSNLLSAEELFLMASCKHNIIANSSFSWWSAWLNKNHDKIIISPTPWVEKIPNPHKNIIPKTWIKIPKNH